MKNWLLPNEKNGYKPYLLRNFALVAYTFVLFFVNNLGGVLGINEINASTINSSNVISLTNLERENRGLPALSNNSRLASAALAKANNMISEQYWDHFGPNGETPWQFIKAAGYTYIYAGENLAKGFKSAEGVVQAWMASPTHRDNLLSGNYKEIGIAVVSGNLLGEEVVLVVQMFGNQTSQTVASATVSDVPEPTEVGDIKSIKITSPKDGEIVNDAGSKIKGEVENVNGVYTVDVSEDAKYIGGVETNGEVWEFEKNGDWSDGEHKVSASLKDEENISDSITFSVDTTAPEIVTSTLVVNEEDDGWEVSIEIVDESPNVTLVSGEIVKSMVLSDGVYGTKLADSELDDSVVIIASDKLGNTEQLDISERFEGQEDSSEIAGTVTALISGIDVKTTFNAIFAAFILALLATEVYVFFKKGMLAKKSSGVLTLSVWWILLVIGLINGFSGSIT